MTSLKSAGSKQQLISGNDDTDHNQLYTHNDNGYVTTSSNNCSINNNNNYNNNISTRTVNIQHSENGTTFPSNNQSCEVCHDNEDSHDDAIINNAPSPSKTACVTSKTNYSVTKVGVVLSISTILSCIVYSTGSVIAQYLLDRWSDDNSHSHNHSGIGFGTDRGLCDKNESDPSVIKADEIEARVSMAIMKYSFATYFPALITCLIFGALVDIIGRKPALISSLLGYTSKTTLVICIIRFNLDPNFFYLAYAFDGMAGGFYVNLIASYSITADISKHKSSRILGIAIITVIGQVMAAAGNIVTGLLIDEFGYVAASSFILAPVALSLIITLFFLPETLPMQKQKASFKKLWDSTTRVVFLYTRDGDRRRRLSLLFSLLIFFTCILNTINIATTDTLYQKHDPLCWDAVQIGYYAAFRNAGGYIGALIFLCICRCIGCASDEVLSMIGMLFSAGGFVLEAFVKNTWQMYMVPVIMIPSGNISSITRGVMSILAGPDKQGVMFSSVAVIEVMCSLAATVLFNKIYAMTVHFMPGFVYLVMAGVSMVTFMLYIPFFHFYDGPPQNFETLVQTQENNDDPTSSSSSSDEKSP